MFLLYPTTTTTTICITMDDVSKSVPHSDLPLTIARKILKMIRLVLHTQSKLKNKRLCSREFGKISNKILSGFNWSLPTIIISSSSNKVNLFVMIFFYHSTLGKKSNPFPDFPPLTKHKFCDFTIMARKVSKLNKNLGFTKATELYKIPIIVLKEDYPRIISSASKVICQLRKVQMFPLREILLCNFKYLQNQNSSVL